jgi:hypothetical protein
MQVDTSPYGGALGEVRFQLNEDGKSIEILIRVSIILACLAGLALAQDMAFNFDPSTDFSKYHTYRGEKIRNRWTSMTSRWASSEKGFDAALAAKGLKRVDSGDTDLVIVFQIATRQEKQITTFDTGGYG